MSFTNKKIIVTGASNGIGKAIAQRFLDSGSEVINFDVTKPDYEIEFKKVDIQNEEEVTNAFSNITHLDVLVNNAGIYFQSLTEDTKVEDLEKILSINIKGTYIVTKHALPFLKKSKGNIINISSGLGIVPEPESPAYCATKAAIIMLTKCWAQEYATLNLRVNAVLPGPIDTPLLRKSLPSEAQLLDYKELNPMKKIGRAEDVANMVAFLASDAASYVTGGLFAVDGGESSSSLYSK